MGKFIVEEIGTTKVLEVYAVVGSQFMFWDEDDQCWFFGEIDRYRPFYGDEIDFDYGAED